MNLISSEVMPHKALDDRSYYYKGYQEQVIKHKCDGVDFYGRTGYALAHGDYTWNAAGLLNSDSSRGIVSTTYNHLGLPVSQVVPSGLISITGQQPTKTVRYNYSADGVLLAINSSVIRYYSGSRIFEGNTLEYSYFPGGYFDSSGNPHYCHADYQGSIIAVTDSTGTVVQTTNYYPYGELWREPSGQPMLFSGKERTTLADYRFGPRSLMSAALLWDKCDNSAHNYTRFSPFSFCGGNPVANIEIDGNDWVELENGEMEWRKDVSSYNYWYMIGQGETYRGRYYTRDKIWLNVEINGNSESGLMTEYYLPSGVMTYKNNTPWVDTAVEEMLAGISETGSNPAILKYFDYTLYSGKIKSDSTPWCAAFINYCLGKSGITGTNSALAFSFKNWGDIVQDKKPIFGAIAIMDYSHVGIVVGQNKDGRIIILGGNQNNAVNMSPNPSIRINSLVYPTNYEPSNIPLPQMDIKGRSLNFQNSR